jgi:hypothetical protein
MQGLGWGWGNLGGNEVRPQIAQMQRRRFAT